MVVNLNSKSRYCKGFISIIIKCVALMEDLEEVSLLISFSAYFCASNLFLTHLASISLWKRCIPWQSYYTPSVLAHIRWLLSRRSIIQRWQRTKIYTFLYYWNLTSTSPWKRCTPCRTYYTPIVVAHTRWLLSRSAIIQI